MLPRPYPVLGSGSGALLRLRTPEGPWADSSVHVHGRRPRRRARRATRRWLRSSGRRPAIDFIEAFELADQEIRVTTQYLIHPGLRWASAGARQYGCIIGGSRAPLFVVTNFTLKCPRTVYHTLHCHGLSGHMDQANTPGRRALTAVATGASIASQPRNRSLQRVS